MICDGLKTKNLDGNSVSVANTWYFSIDAKASRGENIDHIITQLETRIRNGENVTVKYWSPFVRFSCRGLTSNYVYELI